MDKKFLASIKKFIALRKRIKSMIMRKRVKQIESTHIKRNYIKNGRVRPVNRRGRCVSKTILQKKK